MGRKPCCWRVGLTKGAWTSSEDKILINYITSHGATNWRDLPRKAGLNRCGKSCRLRWLNYLKPDIKRGYISPDEEDLIIRLHKLLGNRWSLIAGRLPGRTDNEIKNHWKSKLSKRVSNNDRRNHADQKAVDVKHSTDLQKHDKNHKVIRTRAMRCTKVIDIPYPQNNRFQNDQNSSQDDHSREQNNSNLPMMIDLDGMFVNDDHHDSVEACDADHWMSSWDQQHDTLQGNGAMDLNYLATILNSDDEEWFHQITSNQ